VIGSSVRFLMRLIDYGIGICLALMVGLVFANVIARYGFDSGIVVAEELSRFFFIWFVFLGAVVAMREHAHLGVNSVVRRLPPAGQKLCFVLSTLLMLLGCWFLGQGSWHHMQLGHSNVSAVTGIAQSFFFAPGLVAAAGIALVLLGDLYLLLTGQLKGGDLVQVSGEEEHS
jgi:TRAP-type transport system small permease protein